MGEGDLTTFNLQYDTWCEDREILTLTKDKHFEFFALDQFLKDRNLSDPQIMSGLVDGGDDGGIDSFYCFFNGILLDENLQIDNRSEGEFEIKIFQSKSANGFSPTTIENVSRFIDDLLSFHRQESDYRYHYQDKLMRLIRLFKSNFNAVCARTSPKLSLEFIYVTRLDVNEPAVNAVKAARRLEADARTHYSEITIFPVNFVGVKKLWAQFRIAPPKKKSLYLHKSFSTREGWVGLVTIKDYAEFLKDAAPGSDGNPKIDESIFDSNVRGYNVGSGVNKRITNTLNSHDTEFWQLNNGITIISPTDPVFADEVLNIDNPQIVNGLQTSRRIFDYYRSNNFNFSDTETRRILIRVIKTADEDTRSEIIRATNDQNPMPAEAFLSTMRIQHQIEVFFESKGLFYDRRKGHYKSLNKPAIQIVEILELMQALIAIIRREPEVSRGGPRVYLKDAKRATLFGSDDSEVQNIKVPLQLEVYLRCVQIMRRVEAYLNAAKLEQPTIKNLQGYIALDAVTSVIGNARFQSYQVAQIDVENDLTDSVLNKSYGRVNRIYRKHDGNDAAAKSKPMAEELRKKLIALYSPKKPKKTKAATL